MRSGCKRHSNRKNHTSTGLGHNRANVWFCGAPARKPDVGDPDWHAVWPSGFGCGSGGGFRFRRATESPVAINAELSFADLGEIHWKEWTSGSSLLLVKSVEAARLVARADLQ